MAGGKLTPRQKMINLMYLVFIAMLALNMSKEVLSAFGILNNKIADSNQIIDNNNLDLFNQLAEKATQQPGQYAEKKAKVDKIRKLSEEYNLYVENIKKEVTKDYEKDADGNLPFESMDKGDKVDELWFQGDKLTTKGQEFVDKMKSYLKNVKDISGSDLLEETKVKLDKRFSTADVKSKTAGTTLSYMHYNYNGFPVIATLTKLTQLQNDIKTTENEIVSGMFLEGVKKAASLSAFEAIVVPDKTAFFSGETVTGKIILGKKDPNLKAHAVIVNGAPLSEDKMLAGQALFSFGAGGIGERDITGEFQFKEGDSIIKLPIKGNYVVVPKPNSATISADKMNVVYRGVSNPMTISFAGVPDNNVTVNAPGLSKGAKPGQYNMNPGQGTEVTISVTGKLPDGTNVSDKKLFRIKNVPAPFGAIGKEMGNLKGSKSRLEASQITAELPDFLYDLQFKVTQFTFKVPGQAAVIVNGDRVNAQCKAALARAGRGDVVTISDIKTVIPGTNIVTGRTAPVIYEIQ
ncbi:gliding motility protein GldM [Flavobacterium sp.]|jgi:gliding motility-associated protein GldM|uniref:type IX secretion system motor protein PorM/GldM n=1 Tax=Flavobacterium sp. TaxID=239 RepID=UPI0037BFD6CF